MRLGAKKSPQKTKPFLVSCVLLKYKTTHAIACNVEKKEKKKEFLSSCHFNMTLSSCKRSVLLPTQRTPAGWAVLRRGLGPTSVSTAKRKWPHATHSTSRSGLSDPIWNLQCIFKAAHLCSDHRSLTKYQRSVGLKR